MKKLAISIVVCVLSSVFVALAKNDTIQGGFIDEPGRKIIRIIKKYPNLTLENLSKDADIIALFTPLAKSYIDAVLDTIEGTHYMIVNTNAKKNKILGYNDIADCYYVELMSEKIETSKLKIMSDDYAKAVLPKNYQSCTLTELRDAVSQGFTDVRPIIENVRKKTMKELAKYITITVDAFNPETGANLVKCDNNKVFLWQDELAIADFISKKTKGECINLSELLKNEKHKDALREHFIKKFNNLVKK